MSGELSRERLRLFTILVGLVGALVLFPVRGSNDALAFLLGAGISLISLRSWIRVTDGIGSGFSHSTIIAAVFLMLRYAVIVALAYVMMNGLGIAPLAMIVGLLASFVAVILELLYQAVTPNK